MWSVKLTLRKNTKSGSAIQKALKKSFGTHYTPPVNSRDIPDHLLEAYVELPWQGDGSDEEDAYRKTYVQTLEPLTIAIATALRDAGVKIEETVFDGHRPQPGNRVELTLQDSDHYITYYMRETEAGKKQAREALKPRPDATNNRFLIDVLGAGDEPLPANFAQ